MKLCAGRRRGGFLLLLMAACVNAAGYYQTAKDYVKQGVATGTKQVEMTYQNGPGVLFTDDDDSSEGLYRANLVGAYFTGGMLLSNASNAPANNRFPYFPGCGIFDPINSQGMGCNFIRVMKAFLVRFWINFESLTRTSHDPITAPDGSALPSMLSVDLRPEPPKQIPDVIIQQELPTYYFCFKAILKLYTVTFGYLDQKPMSWPFLAGWQNQKLHFVKGNTKDGTRGDTPIAITLIKGQRMLIVIRGTMWLEEWDSDFDYKWWSPSNSSSSASSGKKPAALLPGKLHSGMMKLFNMFYQSILDEVKELQPKEILITGHSLGAGLAIYMGHLLQHTMQEQFPHKVEVVGFGGPNPGDATFTESYTRTVNARHVIFVGDGAGDPTTTTTTTTQKQFTLGDVVAQYTCGPYPGCDSVGTGPAGSAYEYMRPKSQVAFHPREMKNARRWEAISNLYLNADNRAPSFRHLVASHVCSYLCWTAAAVGDPEDHCYFSADQRTDIPPQYLCNTSSIILP